MPNPFRRRNKSSSKPNTFNGNDDNGRAIATKGDRFRHGGILGVGSAGFPNIREHESMRSMALINTPTASRRATNLAPNVERFNQTGRTNTYHPGRRASVEQRTQQDPYHASLVNGGMLFHVEEDDTENLEPQSTTPESSIVTPQAVELVEDTGLPLSEPPKLNDLIIGRQDPNSRYFTRRYTQIPDGEFLRSVRKTAPFCGLHWCSDVDPAAYPLYKSWLGTKTLPSRYHDLPFEMDDVDPAFAWAACWPLMNAVIMGYSVGEMDFIDCVMDALDQRVPRYVWPDIHTLRHLFGENRNDVPYVLKNFVVDRCVECGSGVFVKIRLEDLPRCFSTHFNNAIRYLEHNVPDPTCEYHTHNAPEACYKSKSR
jgi:hypothetical protein